ncbi:MAG: hypothetical protein M3Z24_01955 [Chloroflexota bacterium]|nr:hypothetical protein [Chloroflexota bacterium]
MEHQIQSYLRRAATRNRTMLHPLPSDIELLTPTTDDDILALAAAQNEAYGDNAPGPEVVERQRAFLRDEGISILARNNMTGDAVGGVMNAAATKHVVCCAINFTAPFAVVAPFLRRSGTRCGGVAS